jgi:signal transduction histidine kinase/ligand-binding sensor domain-containing protein
VKSCFYKTVIILSLVFAGIHTFCQNPGKNLVFDQLTKKQGLPDNNINVVLQDSRGFLWTATNNGIARYDGRNFKHYSTLGKKGITDKIVTCVAEDSKGNIWFGTESGLNKLNPFTELITHYQEGSGPGSIPYRWCNYLYADREKNLWLSTEKGLALYHPDVDSFQNFSIAVHGKEDRINKFIIKIAEDKDGKLWMATSYGVKVFDKKTKNYISYHKEEINGRIKENVFYALHIDKQGAIWAGSFSEGLFKFNKHAGGFEKINISGITKKKFTISDISEMEVQQSRYLLLATDSGLISLKTENNHLVSTCSLQDIYLTKILKDGQDNVWVGSRQGLFKLNSLSLAFTWLPLQTGTGLSENIFHILPDIKSAGKIILLTTQAGWFKYNPLTQSITPQQLPPDKNLLLPYINHYAADSNGYWFTSVKGFGYYNIRNNTLTDLSHLPLAASGERVTGYIVKATDKAYWVTLKRTGILVYNPVTKKDTVLFGDKTQADNTYGTVIRDMQKSSDGNIWFTANTKLYIVDPKTFLYKTFLAPLPDEKVAESKISPQRILFSKTGKVFVYSQLKIYEFKNEKLIPVYPAKGFSDFSIEKITEDPDNNLWVQTAEGIYKTNCDFLRWESMSNLPGLEDGTVITELNAAQQGEMLFASLAKLGILKTNLLKKNNKPLPVIISRVRYGKNENYLVSAQKIVIKSSYKDAVEIELSPADFIDEKENKILYRLHGWDNEWKILSGESVVRYEQLPPGDYNFLTKSANAAGMESEVTNMNFRVIPPFYRTWWFISLMALLLAATTFLFYRFRLKKALELERIRTRIATDLHDDIGATLSSISLYSQALKGQLKESNPNLERVLDKMGENSRDMVASMSDIVWAINPDNDVGEKLVKRMESYAADMCAVKNIKLHFSTDEKLNHLLLPPEHRKNIYLIFKEAINNAVKYANTDTVWVKLILQHKKLVMTITDAGVGFEETIVKKGNGLKNLYSRAAEINGSLHITSAAGEGTTITLHCPV